MHLVVDLTLPVETRLMSPARRVLGGYLETMGVDEEDVADVVLAVAEACANVVRHASLDRSERFRLSARIDDDEVVVVIEDCGVGIPAAAADRVPDATATSGRGLHLMRLLMTSVDVETAPQRQGTKIVMRKSLKRRQPVSAAG